MQALLIMFRLAVGMALLPLVGIVAIWWLVMLPFKLLGALFGGGNGTAFRPARRSGPRHYMVLSNGRFRSYFVTRS